MKKFLILFALASPIFASPILPTATGKELLTYCKLAKDIHDRQFGNPQTEPEYILGIKSGICEGYLMSANENASSFCLPYGYNLLLEASVVVKYLQDHPEQQHLPASVLTAKSLQTYFPCLKR